MSDFAGSLDANIILRLLLNDIPVQHAAVQKLLESHSAQFAVADTAFVELAFVLERHYEFPRTAIQEAIEGLLALPQINANRVLFSQALPLYVVHPALSFEDCCLHAYAELNGATPLWTFDKKLALQADNAKLLNMKI